MADILNPFDVILFPLITEKAVGIIEKENKLSFIVNQRASKADIKGAVEKLYKVKVDKVRTIKDLKGRKKAIVQINKSFKAQDIAMRLGVI
jgi:large subunit ribosomal protein L23